MMAVDTSALMAIILKEPKGADCMRALQAESELVISGATLAEALIVAARRNYSAEMSRLLDGLGLQVATVTAATARRAAAAYSRWGRGLHPAALNFGDCFAYEVAIAHSCPLLFVGDDFGKTDVEPAL